MIDGITFPEGRRLDSHGSTNVLGTVRARPPATQERVELARRYFTEGERSDFHLRARGLPEPYWVDRATGQEFIAVGHDPLLSEDPRTTRVSTFVIEDDALVFLAPRGATGQHTTVELGSMASVASRATGRERIS